MNAVLMLEDGKVFEGKSFGARGEVMGELVFNTSMTGYQEILTDPSYCEQIVTMTYTQIGNYGVNANDVESSRVQAKGLAVREYLDYFSNWQAERSLQDYMVQYGVVGISEIDTRELTRHIRDAGSMKSIISTDNTGYRELMKKLKDFPDIRGRNLVDLVTCTKPYTFNPQRRSGYVIAAYDYGIKLGILRCLDEAGFIVRVMPATTDVRQVLAMDPDGIILSNGPGDPSAVDYAISNIKELIGKKPVFGICLGHQLLALALGAKTYKLKFGHHGANHPVKNLENGKVEITAQNHGFSVDAGSLDDIKSTSYKVTHINLNDGTIEGLSYPEVSAITVQHHPEAGPGPHDSRYIFDKFAALIDNFSKKKG
ncbi:MAG: glutamine-hydrolyzing carbamoyl-phosphate synthase small subunit [Actinobacteria bacterium]|nr:glutamine-hydrolyzing carbamoyl-phosphate synthase small subunit [Actinomycetota bacterium]